MIMIEIFDEDKKDITSSEKRKQKNYKRYTIREKLDIIARAEIIGNRKTVLEYNLDESSIRYLLIYKNEYQNIKNKNSITTLHKGGSHEKNINWALIEIFIITNRKSGIHVSTYLIYLEILKLFDNSEIKISKHAIYERIYRFLERANYSIRVGTNIGQTFPKDSLNLINIFHKTLKK